MPHFFFCLPLCDYYSLSEQNLWIHMGHVPQCRRHWEAHSVTEAMDNTDKNPPVIEDAKEDGTLPNEFLDLDVQTQVLDEQGAYPREHNADPQDHQAEGGNGDQPAEADPTCIV